MAEGTLDPEQTTAEAVSDAIRSSRGDRTQAWLGAEVARLEGRDDAYGQNTVAGWESGRYALKPHKVFVIERALGVPPGSISSRAGYVPADHRVTVSVRDAVRADADLTPDQREDLVAQYEGMVARTRARRRQRRNRSGR